MTLKTHKTGLSCKVGHGYSKEASFKSYEDTKKEANKLKARFKPKKSNPLSEEVIKNNGASTAENSLRMRKKPLSSKVGHGYEATNAKNAYNEMFEIQSRILAERKPKKPYNPLSEHVIKKKSETRGNSLRMRNGKALSCKVGHNYDQSATKESYEETRKHANALLSKHKPSNPRNPLGNYGYGKRIGKNQKRINKGLPTKIVSGYDSSLAKANSKASKKDYGEILKRANSNRNPLGDFKSMNGMKAIHLVQKKTALSGKVGESYTNEELHKHFQETEKVKAAIMARVKPKRSINPLTGQQV
mmetsp:Transcript_21565/g.38251  ORF Transcript_21565/g.38251 Transcript_21565/m.38251 type:complete len:302 (-) Transcript_21565:501-1406(-)|eukprot:CAMPEP_0197521668 /NCGR_PEP_ID=MMETSP1318-20131121/6928_1 /TAXON_ID=552666 /ORGANISM="Partenskyella glossopodia, Strain RCC365" /LENGTH=301 /DNA_ID=CAMNT_0043073757 /DNA_START=25 /DNA_END=930 /DNA_ORIENTATION=+